MQLASRGITSFVGNVWAENQLPASTIVVLAFFLTRASVHDNIRYAAKSKIGTLPRCLFREKYLVMR